MDISVVNGKVTVNGNVFQTNGSSLSIDGNGNVIINGESVLTVESKDIEVSIVGDVENLQTTYGDVKVEGTVKGSVKTVSGDVQVKGGVTGDVQTVSGDVKSPQISGNVKTVSGNIN